MSAVIELDVLGVGLLGPGLSNWAQAEPVLRGEQAYASLPTVAPVPARLPPAERRRAGLAIKMAMAVADAACAHAGADPQALASVFTSSSGDGTNCHALCEALAGADRLLSPTRFTNSVHNAAAGYWHIAVGGRAPSTSLCAFDDSFEAGLIEAATQVSQLRQPLLLVASDTPYPEPLNAVRPLPDSLGLALVLAPVSAADSAVSPAQAGVARLGLSLLPADAAGQLSTCQDAALEQLRQHIPAARGLPLLQALARRQPAVVVLQAQNGLRLQVSLTFPSAA